MLQLEKLFGRVWMNLANLRLCKGYFEGNEGICDLFTEGAARGE